VIDASLLVATFGRMPTEYDDPRTRAATHVGYVARLLRERDVADPRRAEVLDALDRYVAAGEFPTSETDHGLLPTFLDAHTHVRCAVAHLVETTAGTDIMVELDRDHHNAYIDDLVDDPRFAAWMQRSGLTHSELAMIQPSYPPPPPPDVLYVVAAEGDVSVHDDTPMTAARSSTVPGSLTSFGMLDASLSYVTQQLSGQFKLSGELDGKIGITNEDHTAYDADVKLGAELPLDDLTFLVDAGVAVDAYGPELPRAVTMPLDAAIRISHHKNELDLHGGPRISLSGDRGIGANVGLAYRRRNLFCHEGRFDPRDLLISVDLNSIGDHTFIGLTFGVGNPQAHAWWDD
jgi:hypothetical protein